MRLNPKDHIFALILTLMMVSGFLRAYGLKAAPSAVSLPKGLLSLPDETLVERGDAFQRTQYPDSALLCYMIVAQRDLDIRTRESIHIGLKARVYAGSLYYSPFYDYGKAYALFKEAYDLAKENGDHEVMGMAANNIGNVLTVYTVAGGDEEEEGEEDIIGWYTRGIDHYFAVGRYKDALPTLNNLMSMAMDTTLLVRISPLLTDPHFQSMSDSVPSYRYTRRRADGYLALRSRRYPEAISLFRSILSDSITNVGYPHTEIMVDFDLAGVYMLQARFDSALHYTALARDLAARNEMVEVIPGAILMEAEILGLMGDSVSREKALLRYYVAKDSLMNLSRIANYAEPHLRKRIADIDVQLVRAEEERRRARTIIWGLVGLMVIIGSFSFVLVRKNRLLDHKNRHLVGQMEVIDRQERLLLERALEPNPANPTLSSGWVAPEQLADTAGEEAETQPANMVNPEILARILSVMENDRSIFNPDFSIDMLAHLCGEKTKTVSGTLNAALGKNFNGLLNEYRIREMCRLLDSPSASSLTIDAVAQRAGYRSRSTYIAAFRRQTGMTPSEYLKVRSRMTKGDV